MKNIFLSTGNTFLNDYHLYILLLLIISIFILLYTILSFFINKNIYINRIDKYTKVHEMDIEDNNKKTSEYRLGLSVIAKGITRLNLFKGYKNRLKQKLLRANLLFKPEEFMALMLLLFVLGLIITFVVSHVLFVSLILGVLFSLSPNLYLNIKIKKRLKTINSQLPDTISILSNSLKAGHSFFQAIDSVSREMSGPISEEFSKLLREISLGVNTEKSLENMVNRIKSDDLELIITAVLIQRKTGGNLAEVLDNISDTVRQRIKIKGEIKTLTAQGRMSGLIISLLPPILLLVMIFMNPDHISVMFSNILGIIMLVTAVVSELIGIYMVKKVVDIEV